MVFSFKLVQYWRTSFLATFNTTDSFVRPLSSPIPHVTSILWYLVSSNQHLPEKTFYKYIICPIIFIYTCINEDQMKLLNVSSFHTYDGYLKICCNTLNLFELIAREKGTWTKERDEATSWRTRSDLQNTSPKTTPISNHNFVISILLQDLNPVFSIEMMIFLFDDSYLCNSSCLLNTHATHHLGSYHTNPTPTHLPLQ